MRLAYLSTIVLTMACGAHIKREVVGGGTAAVQARGAGAPAAMAGSIALARGTYDLDLRFDVPRAQVIDWTVTCPGVERHGVLGETFEAYRERRIAQIRADRERERKNVAAVTGVLVGAVAPDVHAHGQASGPGGQAQVDATASGQAVGAAAGEAVANATVSDIIELPPGDVGAGRLATRVHVVFGEDGACAVNAVTDDPTVLASFEVTHIRDLDAEARARAIAANEQAHQVRGQLSAQLVAVGADPLARQRRAEAEARAHAAAQARLDAEAHARAEAQAKLDAEARLRAQAQARIDAAAQARLDAEARARLEADARVRAQAQAKIDLELHARLELEARLEASALVTRGALYAYLTGECHADAHHRARVRAEAEARLHAEAELRLQIEARARAQAEVRLRIEREQREARLRAEREREEARLRAQRERDEARLRAEREREAERALRIQAALAVRVDLRAYLVALGARERPPMPPAVAEVQGTPPFSGAVWIAGQWRWTGGRWIWEAGGWRDTTMFGDAGSSGAVISVGGSAGGSVSVGGSTYVDTVDTVIDTVRDHRSAPAVSSQPAVRDHRSEPAPAATPTPRDHRSEPASTSSSTVRDHRDDDSGPRVRDHRR